MKKALFISMVLALFVACWQFPEMAMIPKDFSMEDPAPLSVPCEELLPVDTPSFIGFYSDFGPHPVSATEVYTPFDTLYWVPGDPFAEVFEDFLEGVWPQYEFHCFGDSPEMMGFVVIGTDTASIFSGISFKTEFARGFFGTIPYAMFFMGQAPFGAFDSLTARLQSVQYVNFQGPYDSLQLTQLARNVLGDCKEGGEWADFRFNAHPVSQELVDSFVLYNWNTVLN